MILDFKQICSERSVIYEKIQKLRNNKWFLLNLRKNFLSLEPFVDAHFKYIVVIFDPYNYIVKSFGITCIAMKN